MSFEYDRVLRMTVAAGVLCTFGLAAVPAAAFSTGTTVTVNKATSPFAKCTADAVSKQVGVNHPNTEIEPFIEVSPKNPKRLVAGWQQDRWSNGGARGLAAGYSLDGGKTWKTVVPPGISKCSGGPYTRASDPWVTVSPNGVSYFMSLAFMPDNPKTGQFGANAMLVNRSIDGGKTWSKPIALRVDPEGRALNDKNSMTADPANSRYVYAAWDRLVDFSLPENLKADGGRGARLRALFLRDRAAKAKASGLKGQRADEIFYEGPTYFVRTTDGGKTWEKARKVYDPGGNAQTINNLIEVGPKGAVHLFFTRIDSQGRVYISLLTSTDRGKTFPAAPTDVTEILSSFTGTVTPNLEAPVRDASILFDTAVDPKTGVLSVVWQDQRVRGVESILYSQSEDGGRTWSIPIEVNKTPGAFNRLREQAFVPSIEAKGGVTVVTYYDFRFDDPNAEKTDAWALRCRTKCYLPSSWGAERRLTATSFDLSKAPVARGLFLGDYVGLTIAGSTAIPLYGTSGPAANSTDLSVTPIALP